MLLFFFFFNTFEIIIHLHHSKSSDLNYSSILLASDILIHLRNSLSHVISVKVRHTKIFCVPLMSSLFKLIH